MLAEDLVFLAALEHRANPRHLVTTASLLPHVEHVFPWEHTCDPPWLNKYWNNRVKQSQLWPMLWLVVKLCLVSLYVSFYCMHFTLSYSLDPWIYFILIHLQLANFNIISITEVPEKEKHRRSLRWFWQLWRERDFKFVFRKVFWLWTTQTFRCKLI